MKLITDLDELKCLDPLQVPCEEFDFTNPPFNSYEVGKEMIEIMYREGGLGLAANQVGLKHCIFVMRGTPEKGDFICVNPRIVNLSVEQILLEESCLSYPGLIVKVKRSRHARIRFATPGMGDSYYNSTVTCQFTGITARVVQHEMDHLDGVLFYNRASKYHRDLGFRQRGKYSGYKESKGLLQQTYEEAIRKLSREDEIS